VLTKDKFTFDFSFGFYVFLLKFISPVVAIIIYAWTTGVSPIFIFVKSLKNKKTVYVFFIG
jgi:hypothetical protein